jgi:long-chain acyl-CoA synthetase
MTAFRYYSPAMVSERIQRTQTISELFVERAAESAAGTAYEYEAGGNWLPVTWAEYGEQVKFAALGLKALGFQPGERMAVWGDTHPEWTVLDLAAMALGGCTAGIYQTCTPQQAAYIINDSAAVTVAVDGPGRLARALSVQGETPSVRFYVNWGPAASPNSGAPVYGLGDILARGREYAAVHPAAYSEIVRAVTPETTATLVYTSGTTGPPKGAMLSHKNCIACCRAVHARIDLNGATSNISFLPLSHVAEHVVGFFNRLYSGGTAYFMPDLSRFAEVAKLKRPRVLGAVPRLYEKIFAAIQEKASGASPSKKALMAWALKAGGEAAAYRLAGKPLPARTAAKFRLADRLVLSKIRSALGGQVQFMVCGAAPISKEIIDFWNAAGIPFFEVYGMTESSGISHMNCVGKYKSGTVGTAAPGFECRIAPDGEILVRGDGVFQGYLNQPEATAEAIDAEGWLHTGDIGEMDSEGFLRITDRKKNLIITAGGKNVAPANIELLITREPLISQVVVVGDRRRFLSALITLSTDQLGSLQKSGAFAGKDLEEIAASDLVQQRVRNAVDRANLQLARYENIRTYRILDREFTIESGEMTPTMKLKRKVIEQNYADVLESIYEETLAEAESA